MNKKERSKEEQQRWYDRYILGIYEMDLSS
jgi:hypothetical protein